MRVWVLVCVIVSTSLACAPASNTIGFTAQVGELPFACGQSYAMGNASTQVTPLDFRMYLSGVQLRRDGQWEDATLADNNFQHDGVVLLDFETSQGGCDNGSPDTHSVIDVAQDIEADAIAFVVGIPASMNHLDATTQSPPLNIPSMYWSWADGYKYTKIDVRNEAIDQDFFFHVGASDCSTDDVGSCVNRHEGRVELELDPRRQSIAVDLAAMWSSVNLAVEPPANDIAGCMSFPDDAECPAMLGSLGLQFRDQAAVGNMTAFRVVNGS
jgi:uncharacterized repeat protein (TIGR04052 family)